MRGLILAVMLAASPTAAEEIRLGPKAVAEIEATHDRISASCKLMIADLQAEVRMAQSGASTKARAEKMLRHVETCQQMEWVFVVIGFAKLGVMD